MFNLSDIFYNLNFSIPDKSKIIYAIIFIFYEILIGHFCNKLTNSLNIRRKWMLYIPFVRCFPFLSYVHREKIGYLSDYLIYPLYSFYWVLFLFIPFMNSYTDVVSTILVIVNTVLFGDALIAVFSKAIEKSDTYINPVYIICIGILSALFTPICAIACTYFSNKYEEYLATGEK